MYDTNTYSTHTLLDNIQMQPLNLRLITSQLALDIQREGGMEVWIVCFYATEASNFFLNLHLYVFLYIEFAGFVFLTHQWGKMFFKLPAAAAVLFMVELI